VVKPVMAAPVVGEAIDTVILNDLENKDLLKVLGVK
jgi:hypothetical protein